MKNWTVILALFTSVKLFAQDPKAEMWLGASVPVFLNKQHTWQWHNDAGYRTNGVSVQPHQMLYRSGIRCFLNKHISVATGAALFFTRASYLTTDREFIQENRLWQEIVHQTNQKFIIQLQSRFRLEQRFFEATKNRSGLYATRFRYRTAFVYSPSKKIQLQIADEYMQQLRLSKMYFNQNRLSSSAIWLLKRQSQLQFSYIWQYRSASSSQNIVAVVFQKSIGINGNN